MQFVGIFIGVLVGLLIMGMISPTHELNKAEWTCSKTSVSTGKCVEYRKNGELSNAHI